MDFMLKFLMMLTGVVVSCTIVTIFYSLLYAYPKINAFKKICHERGGIPIRTYDSRLICLPKEALIKINENIFIN